MTTPEETEEAAPRARSFYLVCSLSERATVRVALDESREVSFGRSDAGDVDVVVDDPQVSRRHAVVVRSRAGVYVRDLGSRNGTLVSGETIRGAERRIGAGDVLEVGPMTIVVATQAASFVVADPAMRKLVAAAQRVSRRRTAVLLLGEPGVGKALLAEWIHDASGRAGKPFVRVDCGSLPKERADAELFGTPGAGKKNLLETADRGTLFLADVDELPARAQEELFGFLQTRAFVRDGKKLGALDVRVVCSSGIDLRAAVESGRFHAKLYALVGTLSLRVPPLRERRVEIPVLADYLLRRITEPLDAAAPSLTPEAAALLAAHPWPRNVSDLRDVLEVAFTLSDDGRITPAELPPTFGRDEGEGSTAPPPARASGHGLTLRISPNGESFAVGSSKTISLARRGPLRRVLLRLVKHREAPGGDASLSADELFAAGWPGDKPVGQSAEGRLRTAIWTLRRMGLHDFLVTRDDGYHLAAEVTIAWRA